MVGVVLNKECLKHGKNNRPRGPFAWQPARIKPQSPSSQPNLVLRHTPQAGLHFPFLTRHIAAHPKRPVR